MSFNIDNNMSNNKNANSQTLDSEYAIRHNEAIQKEVPPEERAVMNWQEHHDYYVRKYRTAMEQNEELTEKEKGQYELAMLRETQGFVQPLP